MTKHCVVHEVPPHRRMRPARLVTPAMVLLLAAGLFGARMRGPGGADAGTQPAVRTASLLSGGFATPRFMQQQTSADTQPQAPLAAPQTASPGMPAPAAPLLVSAEVKEEERAPAPPAIEFPVRERMEMSSTMYCLKGHMRTGVRTRDGMAAGDPRVLPLGSVVRVSHPDGRLIGIFVIMDTGGAIHGNKIDIYVDSCREAERWGRRPVVAEVLDIGKSS